MAYVEFDVIAVAERCGITLDARSKNRTEVRARCPFCGDRKYHLSFNTQSGKFRCNRCKESGNAVSLYGKVFSLSNKDAFTELSDAGVAPRAAQSYAAPVPQCEQRPVAERHDVYYDFLRLLTLSDNHQRNLTVKRGMDADHVRQFMYRSQPGSLSERYRVVDALSARHDLHGIPGFFTDDHNEWHMFVNGIGGMYVPVCNKDGYIQGLQLRLDRDYDRFRWFSSSHYKDGTKAASWVHVVGDVGSETACVTEGFLKSDVASVLSGGRLFVGTSGAGHFEKLAEVLSDLGVRRVVDAHDMDRFTNKEVAAASQKLKELADGLGITYVPYSWDSRVNGIDDYLLNRKTPQIAA
jgi:hypothetical protein